ncbi:MAG: DUF4124 domain-containing protein [Pseudomonadota bacterium]
MKRYVMFACTVLFSVTAAAQIHKWVDVDGNVHYTDQPPPKEIKGQILKIPDRATTDGTLPGKSTAEQEMEFRKRRVEQEETATKQQQEETAAREGAANCAQATQQLNALRGGARMTRFNEQGEQVFLDDSARQEAIKQTQKAVDSWCK